MAQGNTGSRVGVMVKRPLWQEENKQDKEEKKMLQNIRDNQIMHCQNVSLSLRAGGDRLQVESPDLAHKIPSLAGFM